jgi:hypothetical protein
MRKPGSDEPRSVSRGPVSFKMDGLRQIEEALGDLSASAGKGVLRRAGRIGLEPFDKAWRARAPRLSGALAEGGGVGSKLTRSQRTEHTRESSVEVHAGPGPHPQAIQQEFGNRNHPAEPFARPALDETRDEILSATAAALGDEMAKAQARAARKAARLAAKAGG